MNATDEINPLYVREMYDRMLPDESLGRLADNPKIFRFGLNARQTDTHSWPYLLLMQDKGDGSYTWHMACHDLYLYLCGEGNLNRINQIFSEKRDRDLEGLEIICRDSNGKTGKHYFLDSRFSFQSDYSVVYLDFNAIEISPDPVPIE